MSSFHYKGRVSGNLSQDNPEMVSVDHDPHKKSLDSLSRETLSWPPF